MERSEIVKIKNMWGTPSGIVSGEHSWRMEIALFVALVFHIIPMIMLWHQDVQKAMEPVVTLQSVDLIDLQEQEAPPVEKPKSALEFLKMALPQPKKEVAPPPPPPPVKLAPPPLKAPPPPIASLSRPAVNAAAPADLNLAEVGRKSAPPAPSSLAPSISLDKRQAVAPAALPSISPVAERRAAGAAAASSAGYGAAGSGHIALTDRPIAAPKPVVEAVAPKEQKAAVAKIEISRSKAQISGPLSSRKVLRSVVPQYPAWARARNIEADVILRFTVGEDGSVQEGAVVLRTSGYPELDEIALSAINQWKFSQAPGTKDQWGEITFRYLLD